MNNAKRKTPYRRLLERVRPLFKELTNPQTRSMLYFETEEIVSGVEFRLTEVYERTLAAQALGWRVVVSAGENGLFFEYEKCKPYIEYELREEG
jgi:hypothetical protein